MINVCETVAGLENIDLVRLFSLFCNTRTRSDNKEMQIENQ